MKLNNQILIAFINALEYNVDKTCLQYDGFDFDVNNQISCSVNFELAKEAVDYTPTKTSICFFKYDRELRKVDVEFECKKEVIEIMNSILISHLLSFNTKEEKEAISEILAA